jgi:hypothetical protein
MRLLERRTTMTNLRIRNSVAGMALLGTCVTLLLAGCATTRQTRSVETHGFLGDYSQLRKGEKNRMQLYYINDDADWSSYHSMIIDSVTIWYTDATAALPDEEAKALTDHLYGALHAQLSKDYTIVEEPGPGVLRLRGAVTQAKGARVVGKTVTSIVPQLRLLTTVAGVASDTQVFVGKATIEVEIVDSLSEQRLGAGVDTRAGTKALRGLGGTWKDVYNAFDYWAERIREHLAEVRAG